MFKSESQFQRHLTQTAKQLGWTWWHDRSASANSRGFWDVVLWREREIWCELKFGKNKLRPEQIDFGHRLIRAGCECYVWRVENIAEIYQVLAHQGRPADYQPPVLVKQ